MDSQPAKKQVYLHIGFPKTGTTSIQVWMTGNADALATQGVLYPVAGRGKGDYRFGHHEFPNALAQNPLSELATSWPDMEELHSEIADSAAPTIILSSEDFATKLDRSAIQLLAHKLSHLDVQIACYLRRQDEFIISVWSTAVANYGEADPLANCLDHPWLDYAHILGLWANAFGPAAIRLRVFEESQLVGGDAVSDFLAICGIEPPIERMPSRQVRYNQRLPAHAAMILAYFNGQNVNSDAAAEMRTLGPMLDRKIERLHLFTKKQRTALLARHEDGNSTLARIYLARQDGKLFNDMQLPDEDDTHDEPPSIAQAFALFVDDVHAALASCHNPIPSAKDNTATEEELPPDIAEPTARRSADLPDTFREMPDEAWLEVLLRTVAHPEVEGFRFPRFPDPELQAAFVGTASEAAIREAFNFYIVSKGYSQALGMALALNKRFIDFGVGWGRFPRIYWKDIRLANLFGCDVDPDAIAICKATGVPGQFDRLYPRGRLPYPDNFFSGGIAYSVFTHLSEQAHLHWMRELGRVLQPGAVFTMTLEPRRFAAFIEAIPDNPTSPWHAGLKLFAAEVEGLRSQFDGGRFAYLPTGGGIHLKASEYGDAIVPPSYIEREWAEKFYLRAYIDDIDRYAQAVAVVQRK